MNNIIKENINMNLNEAKEILNKAGYLVETDFNGIYATDTFDAIFNMSDENFTEFIKLCRQIRKEKKKYKPEYAYTFIANSKLGEKFVKMVRMYR